MYLRSQIPLLLLVGSTCAASSEQAVLHEVIDSSCHNACAALASSLGPLIHTSPFPSQKFFTSQQSSLTPACIFTPLSAQDLSTGLQIIKTYGCHFAVKSGGHARDAGWSSSDGGVSIDLGGINGVEFLAYEGEKHGMGSVRVGSGARWGDVYKVLEGINESVVGGRSADVGVGGFILGGGISFLSRQHGWAIDNVKNFEIVLANGTIANINRESALDLFWALRGGGNNFGIVTRFSLITYPQGAAWGGYNFHLMSHTDISSRLTTLNLPPPHSPITFLQSIIASTVSLIWRAGCKLGYCISINDLFETFQNASLEIEKDPFAHILMAFVYVTDVNLYMGCSLAHYTKHIGGPEVFKNYNKLPHIYTSLRNATLRDFGLEDMKFNSPGYRHIWTTATFRPNATLLSRIADIFLSETPRIRAVRGGSAGLNFQPITLEIVHHFGKNGGNPLGLHGEDKPLMIMGLVIRWSKVEDDAVMREFGDRVLERIVGEAKKMGLHHPYIYQNYAGAGQDVFAGYGLENRLRLMEIQKKYDPEGVFTRLQPGGFKVQDLQEYPDFEE